MFTVGYISNSGHEQLHDFWDCFSIFNKAKTIAENRKQKENANRQGLTCTTGISYFAVCHGRRQRQGWRTAKAFAVCRGQQKAPAK